MTPERYQKIGELYHDALALPSHNRRSFLETACGGDLELSREVESLLAAHEDAGDFMGAPALEVAAASLTGEPMKVPPMSTIGRYQVLSMLGSGGMGDVYLAHDATLGRNVAIKLLRAPLTTNPQSLVRFEQEARAASSLNHPNIVTIHEIGAFGEGRFIAMEFVDGRPLSAMLGQPVPLDVLLPIGRQLAQALAVAHAAGIVHRDLKPENVMVRPDGYVKLLDFGVARLVSPAAARDMTAVTHPGLLIGTPRYMAPEQVRGQPATSATDIFALGAVLYELAAGKHPFEGESTLSLLHAIVSQAPVGPSRWVPDIPATLERLILCMLQQEEAARPTAGEVDAELRAFPGAPDPSPRVTPASRRRPGSDGRRSPRRLAGPVWLAVAVAVALGVWGLAAVWTRQRAAPPTDYREALAADQATHRQFTFFGSVREAAISSDGKQVAYVREEPTGHVLVSQAISGGPPLELFRASMIRRPRWSPDGTRLAASVIRTEAMYRPHVLVFPRAGGEPRDIGIGPLTAWAPDGRRLAVAASRFPEFSIVDTATGSHQRIPVKGVDWLHDLDWSAVTNRLVILTERNNGPMSIATVGSDGSGLEVLLEAEGGGKLLSPRWDATGQHVYCLRSAGDAYELIRIPFPKSATAKPLTLIPGLLTRSFVIAADDNRLVYNREARYSNLWRLALTPDGRAMGDPEPLTQGRAFIQSVAVAPDGRALAYSSGTILPAPFPPEDAFFTIRSDIFVVDAQGQTRQLTDLGTASTPAWAPDGRSVAFTSPVEGTARIWIADARDGLAQPHLSTWPSVDSLLTWSPGSELLYRSQDGANFVTFDPNSQREHFLLPEPVVIMLSARFASDGRRLAVALNDLAKGRGLFVVTADGKSRRLVTTDVLFPVGWSPDDTWIYAYDLRGNRIRRVRPEGGYVETVFTFRSGTIAEATLANDGRALVCALIESNSDIWIADGLTGAPR